MSWGCLPFAEPARVIERDWRFEPLPDFDGEDSALPYGQGKSYGDVCINSHGTQLSTRQLKRLVGFDASPVRAILRTLR